MPYHTIRYFGDKKYVVNVCDQTGEVYHKDHIGYVSVYSENANKWFGSYNDLYEFKYGKKIVEKKIKKQIEDITKIKKTMIIEDMKIKMK